MAEYLLSRRGGRKGNWEREKRLERVVALSQGEEKEEHQGGKKEAARIPRRASTRSPGKKKKRGKKQERSWPFFFFVLAPGTGTSGKKRGEDPASSPRPTRPGRKKKKLGREGQAEYLSGFPGKGGEKRKGAGTTSSLLHPRREGKTQKRREGGNHCSKAKARGREKKSEEGSGWADLVVVILRPEKTQGKKR